ncbi:MAG: tetratricopeptide repeat protein [Promethearchaeota archaeon]
MNEDKEDEAWQKIAKWENSEQLTPEENHYYIISKAMMLYNTGKLQEGLKIVEEHYIWCKNQKNSLYAIDMFIVKWHILFLLGDVRKIWEDLLTCENTLKNLSGEPQSDIDYRLALIYLAKSQQNYNLGELDKALKHFNEALEIFKQSETVILHLYLCTLGFIYTAKGELDQALKTHNESLEHSRGNYMLVKIINATSYNNLGLIYFQKGDLDKAIDYYEKSLRIWEQYSYPLAVFWEGGNYISLINAFLFKNPKKAQEYLDLYLSKLKKRNIPENFYLYRLAKAKILRSSKRIRNRAEAEEILRDLSNTISPVNIDATIELCDFYVEELKATHDLEVLDDIKPYIEKLLIESKRTNSYFHLAHTYLLQGQLALFQINMGDARKYLTTAQRIAEDHDLQLLARTISGEHDKLLSQLEEWEILNKKKLSIPERIDLTSLDITIDRMQGTRTLEPPELINEEPVLLLIMGEDGVPYFNHSFIEGWDDKDLFSGFMSAFNSFSSELFAKSIDRIKIDENIILLKPVETFIVCYVIKGQSYPALMKLTRFSDAIKWKPEIWDALTKAVKTSEVLELHNPSSLGDVVNEIFK